MVCCCTRNEGDNIYVTARPIEKGYRGFWQGYTLNFKLEDGTIDSVQGPWYSNSNSLFLDTGYDIRDKHYTFGVISRAMESVSNPYSAIMKDVIYKDEGPVIGNFNRVEKLAEDFANKEGKPIFCYSESSGGSSRGMIKPYWMELVK